MVPSHWLQGKTMFQEKKNAQVTIKLPSCQAEWCQMDLFWPGCLEDPCCIEKLEEGGGYSSFVHAIQWEMNGRASLYLPSWLTGNSQCVVLLSWVWQPGRGGVSSPTFMPVGLDFSKPTFGKWALNNKSSLCVVQSLCYQSFGLSIWSWCETVCESESPRLICFVKTFMSQLIRGFTWSDLNFKSFVGNHIFSFPLDTQT